MQADVDNGNGNGNEDDKRSGFSFGDSSLGGPPVGGGGGDPVDVSHMYATVCKPKKKKKVKESADSSDVNNKSTTEALATASSPHSSKEDLEIPAPAGLQNVTASNYSTEGYQHDSKEFVDDSRHSSDLGSSLRSSGELGNRYSSDTTSSTLGLKLSADCSSSNDEQGLAPSDIPHTTLPSGMEYALITPLSKKPKGDRVTAHREQDEKAVVASTNDSSSSVADPVAVETSAVDREESEQSLEASEQFKPPPPMPAPYRKVHPDRPPPRSRSPKPGISRQLVTEAAAPGVKSTDPSGSHIPYVAPPSFPPPPPPSLSIAVAHDSVDTGVLPLTSDSAYTMIDIGSPVRKSPSVARDTNATISTAAVAAVTSGEQRTPAGKEGREGR